jgi:hypothetical protein
MKEPRARMDDKVYLVIQEDRHYDVQIDVYRDRELALRKAKAMAEKMVALLEGRVLEEEQIEGWL